jgi:hypothetical protein
MKHNTEALVRKVEQLERFRAEVQAICESGKHRTMHTQLQMCGFLDGLRCKALAARIEVVDVAPAAPDIEPQARAIYESWSTQPGFVPWVDGGNSTMQQKARAEARRGLEIAG